MSPWHDPSTLWCYSVCSRVVNHPLYSTFLYNLFTLFVTWTLTLLPTPVSDYSTNTTPTPILLSYRSLSIRSLPERLLPCEFNSGRSPSPRSTSLITPLLGRSTFPHVSPLLWTPPLFELYRVLVFVPVLPNSSLPSYLNFPTTKVDSFNDPPPTPFYERKRTRPITQYDSFYLPNKTV